MNKIDETKAFKPVNIAVLTVSDTRTFETDKPGETLVERIQRDGRVPARLGRHVAPAARHPLPALQPRRADAAPQRRQDAATSLRQRIMVMLVRTARILRADESARAGCGRSGRS